MADKEFGSLEREKNRIPIMTGTGIQTQDGATVPVTSPHTFLGTGNIFTLEVPDTGAEIAIYSSVPLRVSEDPAMATYFVIPQEVVMALGITRMDNLYFDADTGGGTMQFYFIKVD